MTFLLLIALLPIFITIAKSDSFIFKSQCLFALGILRWTSKKKILNKNMYHILARIDFFMKRPTYSCCNSRNYILFAHN